MPVTVAPASGALNQTSSEPACGPGVAPGVGVGVGEGVGLGVGEGVGLGVGEGVGLGVGVAVWTVTSITSVKGPPLVPVAAAVSPCLPGVRLVVSIAHWMPSAGGLLVLRGAPSS